MATCVQDGAMVLERSQTKQAGEFGTCSPHDWGDQLVKQSVGFIAFAARRCNGASDLPFAVMMTVTDTDNLQRVGHAVLTGSMSVLKSANRKRASEFLTDQVCPCSGIDQERQSTILQLLNLKKNRYTLVTVHRAANTDDRERMSSILSALSRLSLPVIFPVHPRAQKMMGEWGISAGKNVILIEPVGHFDMLALQENANCILTDSGGVQKEAYLVGVRCITLREETEWVETVSAGWNSLVGVDEEKIVELFENWFPTGKREPLYGDGHASEKIAKILLNFLK